MLVVLRQRFGQPGQGVGTQPRAGPTGKSLTQTGNGLPQCPLRRQDGAAQELRFEHEP